MAISNFTKSVVSSVFPAFLIPASLRPKHENISCSLDENAHPEVFLSAQNASALKMISKSYCFRHRDDYRHKLYQIGVASVVSVIINHSHGPEVGLLSPTSEHIDFFLLSDLLVIHEVIRST